jgi:hypothetical protein
MLNYITQELYNNVLIIYYYKYDNLLRQEYEKYNLFELIILLDKSGFKSVLNKKAIINTFVNNMLNIKYYDNKNEEKKENIHYMFRVQGNSIKWKIQKIVKQIYNIVIVNNNKDYIMEINTGDIIKIGNKEYNIYMRLYQYLSQKKILLDDERYDTMCVILDKNKPDERKDMSGQEFIELFENEDVTYIKRIKG